MGARVSRRVVALAAVLAIFVPATIGRPGAAQSSPPSPPAGSLVRIPFPRDDGSLTPYTFRLGYPLMTLVYDTLLWRDIQGVPQPWLAKAVEVSPDVTRFTIRLTPGVTWHDGAPLTSDDVRFTFRYVASHASARFSAEVANVANVTAPDPATVVITTRQPAPGFADLTLADLPILPAHLWQSLPPGQDVPAGLPVGSGPYRLVGLPKDGGYRFEANAGYFRGTPNVARISAPIIKTYDDTVAQYRDGGLDVVPLSLPPNDVKRLEGVNDRVIRGAGYFGVQLAFNLRHAPFDDPALRQAVAKAIDLPSLSNVIGDAVPADQGMLHPASAFAPGSPLKVTDEAAARAALAKLTEPIEVLSPNNDPMQVETARQVALALGKAGVKATSVARPASEVEHLLGFDTPAAADCPCPGDSGPPRTDFTLAVTGIDPKASFDPDYLARLFGSGAAVTSSGYKSPAFDQLAKRVATTTDPSARRALVADELRLLSTDLPSLPLFFPNGAYVFRPAAYDGWRYIRGLGLLDKQSLLPGDRTGDTPVTAATPKAEAPPPPVTTSGGGLPSWLVPSVFVALALGLVGVAVARQRR